MGLLEFRQNGPQTLVLVVLGGHQMPPTQVEVLHLGQPRPALLEQHVHHLGQVRRSIFAEDMGVESNDEVRQFWGQFRQGHPKPTALRSGVVVAVGGDLHQRVHPNRRRKARRRRPRPKLRRLTQGIEGQMPHPLGNFLPFFLGNSNEKSVGRHPREKSLGQPQFADGTHFRHEPRHIRQHPQPRIGRLHRQQGREPVALPQGLNPLGVGSQTSIVIHQSRGGDGGKQGGQRRRKGHGVSG